MRTKENKFNDNFVIFTNKNTEKRVHVSKIQGATGQDMTFILRKVIKLYLQRTEGEENSGKY